MFTYCYWLLLYVLAVLFANVYLDSFIKLPLFGLFSIGSIFFAAIFTLRDRLHSFGLFAVYFAISLAVLITTFYGQFVAHIELRFIFASFVAILVGELADTAVFEKLKKSQWHVRVLGSNAVSVPLDSTAFTLLAFVGILGSYEIWQIIYADVVGKYLIAAIIAYLPYIRSINPKSNSINALFFWCVAIIYMFALLV